jgi:hypothetical protein
MLRRDDGNTYCHHFVGTKWDVIYYARRVKHMDVLNHAHSLDALGYLRSSA